MFSRSHFIHAHLHSACGTLSRYIRKMTIALGILMCALIPCGPAAHAAGAWIAEWDLRSGLDELRHGNFDRVILFAAYFSSNDKPFLQENLQEFISEELAGLSTPGREVYLSIVNDRFNEGGGATLKDPALVTRLMASPDSRTRHKEDLLQLLSYGPFAGLELDYEKVKEKDWPVLLDFAAELSRDLAVKGKKLRVVLEPRKGCLQAALPNGPEYVLMAYNLFGSHSGPGPKADFAFLEKLASWCAHMPVKPRLALATGGFAWGNDGTAPLTEEKATTLMQGLKQAPDRDTGSGYRHLRTKDESKSARTLVEAVRGVYTEIWFADGETLGGLAAKAKALGFSGLDLWRLGGNRKDSIERFLEGTR